MPEQEEPPAYRATVIIVPGWLWEQGGGADFKQYRALLKRWGVPHKFIRTDSADSLEQNAMLVRKAIADVQGPAILVTGSRGTLETVVALAGVVGEPADLSHVGLWVNISGAQYGTAIADEWTQAHWRFGTPIWAFIVGSTYEQIYAMRTDVSRERFWKLWPYVPRIPTVSIVARYDERGPKPSGFIGIACDQMKANSPSDCLIRCIDQPLPGSVVIEADGEHMLENIQAPLINRIINAAVYRPPSIWNVAQ